MNGYSESGGQRIKLYQSRLVPRWGTTLESLVLFVCLLDLPAMSHLSAGNMLYMFNFVHEPIMTEPEWQFNFSFFFGGHVGIPGVVHFTFGPPFPVLHLNLGDHDGVPVMILTSF